MGTLVFAFLITYSHGPSPHVTPMPSMAVCEQVAERLGKKGATGAPKCIEIRGK